MKRKEAPSRGQELTAHDLIRAANWQRQQADKKIQLDQKEHRAHIHDLEQLIKSDPLWLAMKSLRHDHNLHKFLNAIWQSYKPKATFVSMSGEVENLPATFKLYTIDSPFECWAQWLKYDPSQKCFVSPDQTKTFTSTAQAALHVMDQYARAYPVLMTTKYDLSWTPNLAIWAQRDSEGCLYRVTAPKLTESEFFPSKEDILIRLYELYSQDIA